MGSKNRLSKYFLPVILSHRNEGQTFVEPFCGGCNLTDKVEGPRIASDANKYLIGLWKALQSGWTPPEKVTREMYNETKANKDAFPPELVGWIGFVWSFRGTFYGAFVGEGVHRCGTNYGERGAANVLAQVAKLEGVDFRHSTYDALEIPDRSLIYCDPPYAGVSKYKFEIDHEKFWEWCRQKNIEGHTVFVSEYDAPDDFVCLWMRETKSTLAYNSKTKSNNVVIHTERLFVHETSLVLMDML
jgi:DNA adenine methylase